MENLIQITKDYTEQLLNIQNKTQEDEVYYKYVPFYGYASAGTVRLVSLNNKYKDIIINEYSNFTVVGKVVM